MKRLTVAGLSAGLLCAATPARSQGTGPVVTFDWPQGLTNSSFFVKNFSERPGVGADGSRETAKFSAPMPDGKYELRVGESSLPISVEGGLVHPGSNPAMGVRFDGGTNAFIFSKVTIKFDGGDYRMPVAIVTASGPLNREPGKVDEVTLVPAQYRLNYGGNNNSLLVGTDGRVTMGKATAGFVTEGNTLRFQPRPIHFEPGAGVKGWNILRGSYPLRSDAAAIPLLPGDYSLNLQPSAGKATQIPFSVNDNFLLSTTPAGPFQEVLGFKAENGPEFAITIPYGREVIRVRLAKAEEDRKTHDAFIAETDKAPWKHDFVLKDYMRFFDYREQLVSYPVEFPAGKVRAESLSLANLSDGAFRRVPFQLTEAVQENGFLRKATLNFRSDLPKGAQRMFRLVDGLPQVPVVDAPGVTVNPAADGKAVMRNSKVLVRVPSGFVGMVLPKALSSLPAPILAISRPAHPDTWLGAGQLVAPESIRVKSCTSETELNGPLIARQRITYTLTTGGIYTVLVTLRADDDFATIDESISGFKPEDEAYFRFDLTPNFSPDQRQVMSNGGYGLYSGDYERDAGVELPFELGLNTPNSLGVMRAAAFWRRDGADVLLLAVNRAREWKTARRMIWYDSRSPGNLTFQRGYARQSFQSRLEGRERHWAMALQPLDRHVPGGYLTDEVGAGPEVRLWQQFSDFDLNAYKDWTLDWDENLTARSDDEPAEPMTFEAWLTSRNGPQSKTYRFLSRIPEVFWDYSAEVGPVSFRGMPELFRAYAVSRAGWTLDQRRQARSVLLFLANSCEGDANVPHNAMLGGHPNFIMDVKQTLALACATFPNHPDAPKWKAAYMKYLNEALDVYQRKPDPEHNALGGRWTENTVCYSFAALTPLFHAAIALKKYDGTDLLADPRIQTWIRWHRNVMTSPNDGQRLVPPEGAHSDASLPGTPFWKVLFEIAEHMKTSDPQLAAEMKWLETSGKEGTKPILGSMLITDHGPFLRHDFGGEHEAYLHLLQLSGRWNYRWGNGDMLYYGAKNKLWSYNGREDNGDEYDINNLTAFSVKGKGLGRHDTDQTLYNFGFAQYYRALAGPDGALAGYKSRGMMLLRDDYLVLYDAVADLTTKGQFTWSTAWDFPQIYQLKPGANFTEDTHQQYKGEFKGVVAKIRRYAGQGDFRTVIAPAPVQVQNQPYGATVNGEQVFMRGDTAEGEEVAVHGSPPRAVQGGAVFAGTAGYARPNQLAIFEGSSIALNGFELSREGGDFGVSAEVTGKTIQGRFAGRGTGKITITPPAGFDAAKAKVIVNGQPAPVQVEGKTLSFQVQVAQRDGTRSYIVSFD